MMQIIEYTLMALGTLCVLASLGLHYRRSGEPVAVAKIIRGQLALNSREFFANRVGLYLLVMGVLVRYVNQLG